MIITRTADGGVDGLYRRGAAGSSTPERPPSDLGEPVPPDLDLLVRHATNVLLIGSEERCEAVLSAARSAFADPVVGWQRRDRLLLPAPDSVGTLILHGVNALDRMDQYRLFGWIGASRATRVVATTPSALNDALARGTFLPELYYRLNILCISLIPHT